MEASRELVDRQDEGAAASSAGTVPGGCMPTTTPSSRTSYAQWLIESRPPSISWSRSSLPQANQPPLDLTDQEANDAAAPVLDSRGVRVSLVKAGWAAKQRPGLPDAREWSTTLALALIQALLGQRPVAHPNRSKRALAGTGNRCRRGPRLRHPVLGQPCVRRPNRRIGRHKTACRVPC
jgi:hypothetical protein